MPTKSDTKRRLMAAMSHTDTKPAQTELGPASKLPQPQWQTLLKQLQTLVPTVYRDRIKRYRQAYIEGAGASEDICNQQRFPCDTPHLMVQQDSRTYRIL
ncbi:hypothetical protein J6590_000026 [Homalodisca vitripennis]|nr:hypothetical protein J6590_000026 [Homalodisca vitripennis]